MAFYAYVASIPFEIENRPIPIEIPTLMGCIFLLATLLQPGICFRTLPRGFWLFMAFFVVDVLSGLLNGFQYPVEILKDYLRLMQLIAVFWTGYNVMSVEPHIATVAVATLAVSSLLRALLQLGGIGVTTDITGRVQVFGQNENSSAGIMAAGLLILIGLTYARTRSTFQPRLLIWPFVAIFAVAVVQTGSRGALVALVAGLCCFVFTGSSLRRQLTNACVVLVAVIAVLLVTLSSQMMRDRWLRTLKRGDMAKREKIIPIYTQMFYEKPLLGWGPYTNSKEGGRRLRLRGHRRISPHNLPQELLTSTGIIGTVPMTAALVLVSFAAWRARRGVEGTLPLALLASVMAHNLSLDLLRVKLFWFVLAYASACGSVVREKQQRLLATRSRLAATPLGRFSPNETADNLGVQSDAYERV
jgi:hypothetical protein